MSELEMKLASMQSFEAIKEVLDGISLHDLQCIDIMKMLASKRSIVSYSTGLGKTVLAAGVMKLLWNEDPSRKFIFFGTKDQLTQTPRKLEAMCGRKVVASFASADSLQTLFDLNYGDYSVLFLTHGVLSKDRLMNDLFKHRSEYCGVFIDEAHELSNVGFAKSASILAGVVRQFEYCYALTATPITTAVKQLAKLSNLVDSVRFPDARKLELRFNNGATTLEDYPCFYINRTRADFGSQAKYNGLVEFVEPLPHQRKECGGNKLFSLCKGPGAYPQAERLVSLVKQRSECRGLIYVNQHEVREWILPFLEKAGVKYACVNGYTKLSDRMEIERQFNEEKSLDVVITSVTTALDLDCDYVIFYEFTVDVKQMIGRAHRGLGDKELDVIFIITEDTSEIDYFYDNIYSISMTIKEIMHHDYSELEQVDREIKGTC